MGYTKQSKNGYLSDEVLSGFDHYKYNAVDTSPLSNYVMHPFWNWLVQFYPRWLAPNVLTFAGFVLQVLCMIVLQIADPEYLAADDDRPDHPPVPGWIWLIGGLMIFLSHQLDGTDGKQARRTGSSSPLGELFDHGLDSYACFFMPVAFLSIYGRGQWSVSVLRLFLVQMGVQLCFVLSHWEKYNTGVLYLPWSYDLSQILMAGFFVATFFGGGHGLWKFSLVYGEYSICCNVFLEIGMHAATLCCALVSIWNVIWSYANGTGFMRSTYEAMKPLLPIFLLFGLMIYWSFLSPTQILEQHPKLFMFLAGTIFSNICCRLIVSQMSGTKCEAFNWLLLPLVSMITAISIATFSGLRSVYFYELEFLTCYALLAALAHLHFGISVVTEMADHFNIYVFSLEKRPYREDAFNNKLANKFNKSSHQNAHATNDVKKHN